VDHGAQYFTIRDGKFQQELEKCCGNSLQRLAAPVVDRRGAAAGEAGERWYHREGNNRIGKNLLGDLPVIMEAKISRIVPRGGLWIVGDFSFDAVVSSAPLPQSLALAGLSAETPGFAPCLTAFFSYRGDWAGDTSACYARRDPDSALAWSACENHKTGRIQPGQTVIVAQASAAFSVQHLEDDPAEWLPHLQALVEDEWRLSPAGRISQFSHRWRYARFQGSAPLPELPKGFHLTGDALTESRVESAWLAGQATARQILAGAHS